MQEARKLSPDGQVLTELRESLRRDIALNDLGLTPQDRTPEALRELALRATLKDIGAEPSPDTSLLAAVSKQARSVLLSHLQLQSKLAQDCVYEFFSVPLSLNPALKAEVQVWARSQHLDSTTDKGNESKSPRLRNLENLAGQLPGELFEKVLFAYCRFVHEQEQSILAKVEKWKTEFIDRVEAQVKEGRLPESALRARETLDTVSVRIVDGLFWGQAGFRNLAQHAQTSRVISMHALNRDQDQQERAFSHELVHAISGRTEQMLIDQGEISGRRGSRLGLDLHGFSPDAGRSSGSRFGWLNEAVTESVNLQLLGHADSSSYRAERAILSKLEERIPRMAFLEAYFEHYEPSAPPETRLQGWKQLSAAFAREYEPGFLTMLDKCVDLTNPARALQHLENGPEAVRKAATIRRIKLF